MDQLREFITLKQYEAERGTRGELRAAEIRGDYRQIIYGMYGSGDAEPTPFDISLAHMLRRGQPAWGAVAGLLYGLDAADEIELPDDRRRRVVDVGGEPRAVDGVLVTSGLQTMVDLALVMTPLQWEQANECALRDGLFTIDEQLALVEELSRKNRPGAALMRGVLALRPLGAPPTESMLETLGIQMCRANPDIPEPTRQFEVVDFGGFTSRLDTCWPFEGAFCEYDGQGHKGQPVYDANRQTRVAAATGWPCARLTWQEVRYNPVVTGRRVARLLEQARRRGFVA